MKDALTSLEALFTQFNTRRLAFWLFVLACIVAGGLVLESLTGFLFYRGMEKRVTLLKDLHALAQDGIANEPDLAPIYQRAVAELAARNTEALPGSMLPTVADVLKFTGSAAVFLVLAFAVYSGRENNAQWKSTLYGALVFAAVIGFLSTFVPTLYSPWVNFFIVPIGFLLLLAFIARLGKGLKRPAKA